MLKMPGDLVVGSSLQTFIAPGSRQLFDALFFTQQFNVAEGMRLPGDTIDLIYPTDTKQFPLRNIGIPGAEEHT